MKKITLLFFVTVLIILLVVSFSFVGCKSNAPTTGETTTTAAAAEETTTTAAAAEETTTTAAPGNLTKMTFISPRGTLEVMDDYNLWVAIEMGYFKDFGIDVDMEPGPNDALATTKFVDQKKADVGYPSPGVLTASVDTGMDVIQVFEMMASQVFDFAVKQDSPIKTVQDLKGKTISIGMSGWTVIVDPILVEAGIDPKSVKYVTVGESWGQAVAQGQADAALCWRGLRAQWDAQGLNLRYLIGETFSKHPANGYCVRKSDLSDSAKKDLYVKFFKAAAMGIEFARINPRAAAQITYNKFAAVREQMTPKLALDSMNQLHWAYTESERKLGGYGMSPVDSWKNYLDTIYQLGQTKNHLTVDQVITNDLIKDINSFDKAKVKSDAENFKLDDTWKNVEVTGNW
ncbi:MAG: ABC transporter substrate-binding protein [Actinobacteria bacterium]|nr:ABC transporter substrate-binding protein [Cyanobacteriota bacterium]MCL5771627.1 ABC transporter substrate-binding protein [Actinomycetota bacterium]